MIPFWTPQARCDASQVVPKIDQGLWRSQLTIEARKLAKPITPPAVATGKSPVKRDAPAGKRKKRSTTRGKGQTKLLSALAVHHRYGQPCGLLNLESIGCRALAKAVGVAPATASKFFKDNFGSLTSYEGICRDAKGLHAKLKLLYDDFADPSYGSEPNEGDE